MRNRGHEHFTQIDSLRAAAITIVVLNHALIARNFPLGGFGIGLFFVLSGYFATRSLLGIRWRCTVGELEIAQAAYGFTKRRWQRLLPVYFVVLAAALLLQIPDSSKYLIWNLSLTTNFAMLLSSEWAGFFSPFWSLAALEQILLVWPWVILLLRRRRLNEALWGMALLAIVYRGFCAWRGLSDFWWFMPPIACLDSIAIGGLLAIRRSVGRPISSSPGVILGGLFGAIVAFKALGIQLPFAPIYVPAVAALFFAWLLNRAHEPIGGLLGQFLGSRLLSYIGKASYSIFLVHGFVIYAFPVAADVPTAYVWLQALASLVGSVLLGGLVYRLIERPLTVFRGPVGTLRRA